MAVPFHGILKDADNSLNFLFLCHIRNMTHILLCTLFYISLYESKCGHFRYSIWACYTHTRYFLRRIAKDNTEPPLPSPVKAIPVLPLQMLQLLNNFCFFFFSYLSLLFLYWHIIMPKPNNYHRVSYNVSIRHTDFPVRQICQLPVVRHHNNGGTLFV